MLCEVHGSHEDLATCYYGFAFDGEQATIEVPGVRLGTPEGKREKCGHQHGYVELQARRSKVVL